MRRSESGFSMIQVMVAGAIALSIVYFLSSSLIQVGKESARISVKADLLQLKSTLGEILRNPATCVSNFDGRVFDLTDVNEEKIKETVEAKPPIEQLWTNPDTPSAQVVAYKKTSGSGKTPGVALESISLKNWQKIKDNHFTAELELIPGNNKGPLASVTLPSIDIRTDPESPNGAKKITYCRLIGMSSVPAPTSMIFPALSRGTGANKLDTAGLADATCALAYGSGNFHCDLLKQYCSDFGDKEIAGGIYKCAMDTALPQACPSPTVGCK